MAHGLLDDRVWNGGHFLRPGSESRPEAVRSDWSSVGCSSVDPENTEGYPDVSGALDPLGAGGDQKRDGKRNEAVSKTKKIVNMLADDTSAPAAARTLAKAAEQQGKLISDYLMERLQHEDVRPTKVWDKIRTAAGQARDSGQDEREKFAPSEPPPPYQNPKEVTAMFLAYGDQIKFLDRLKLIVKAMKGLPPDTTFSKALAAALEEGWRALKVFEKEQEPAITAGLAARKASREAYAAAVKAWEMRMELERATSEKTRPEH